MPERSTWIGLTILLLVCLVVSLFLVQGARAEESVGYIEIIGDAIDTILGTEKEEQEFIPYIYQGDAVYVGTYVDISGVVPPYPELAYWDGYAMYDSTPSFTIELPDNKKGYYKFYIDPEVFNQRRGIWYKYDGQFEPQGNNVAFVVSRSEYKNSTMRYSNGTMMNVSEIVNASYVEPTKAIQPSPVMEEQHLSDYIVAKGDALVFNDCGAHYWLFGSKDGIYDIRNCSVPSEEMLKLTSGSYILIKHLAGPDTIYDSQYINGWLVPGIYGRKPIDVTGYAAPVVQARLVEALAGTDDITQRYKVELEEPYITIRQVDEIIRRDMTDALDVRGYTNVANGTAISVVLDEDTSYYRNLRYQTANTTAIRTNPGNLSYYQAIVPFNWDDLAADARNHTLRATTVLGGRSERDFKVSVMPADSYKPNASLKYIEDRNPFVPTPTPATVYVTKTVIRTVTIPVTPSNEQVYAQQKAAEDAKWQENVMVLGDRALLVVIGMALTIALWYGITVFKRGRQMRGKPPV